MPFETIFAEPAWEVLGSGIGDIDAYYVGAILPFALAAIVVFWASETGGAK